MKDIIKKYLTLTFLFVVLGGFSTRAWGASPVEFNSTKGMFLNSGVDNSFNNSGVTVSDSDSKKFSIVQDSVEFRLLSWDNYDKKNADGTHFYIFANSSKTIHWYPNDRFSVSVSKIEVYGQNGTWETGSLWWKETHTGTAYFRKNNSASNVDSYSNSSWNTKTVNFSPAFGSEDYITVATQNEQSGSTGVYRVQWLNIYYTVTPPAPTLKNGSSVTRSQYVEGRSNNTITLTDYFEPFNSGVSMSYVVKKKNGSGVYETINSGYDITDNVFKTTVVGEYQIFANSNATGAFNASSSSSALAVEIEEVRPVTISVGSQELYVGGTTSMTITEQLNTTNDVDFDYDSNFFDYNKSTGVLTAKNDGNASFTTTTKSIRVTQESDGEFAAVDMTINFTIKKNVPTFTWNTRGHYYHNDTIAHFFKSSNTATTITVTSTDAHKQIATIADSALVLYNKAGTARVTMTQAENYYWAEHTEYRDITPEWKNNQLTLTVTEDNYTSVIENRYAGSSDRFRWLNGGVLLGSKDISLSDGAEGWDSRYIDIHFTGMPDSLSFTYERSVSTATGMDWWVKEKTENGEWGDETIYHPSGNPADGSCKVALKPDTRWVRLRGYCNYGVYFRNIKITKREQFETDSTSFDFKTQIKNANVPSKSFKFKHANAGYTVTATSNDSHYKVSLNNSDFYSSVVIPNTGGDKMDSSVVYVKYYPSIVGDVEETHNATITFSDALSNSATVSLTGKTQAKLATSLEYIGSDSYSVNADNIAATSLFQVVDANGAVVASPIIKLTSSDSTKIDIVHVDGKDYIDFLCGAEDVRITAIYAGDDDYAAASNLAHSITVNKVSDVFSWNDVEEDGKIHVWTDSLMPLSYFVSANTDISALASSNTSYLGVTGSKGSFALQTRVPGEVTLTATSEGDCTYNSTPEGKTIVVEAREHSIIWEQNLAGIQTNDRGNLTDYRIPLNAYAVDSKNDSTKVSISYEITGGGTFAAIDGDELVINVADLSGTLETTVTATTMVGTKYAIVSVTKAVSVVRWGTNTATSANDETDIVDGKIVMAVPHATFTFSGPTSITAFHKAFTGKKPEGYKLVQNLKSAEGSKTYNFSWVCTNANCSIQVTKISFWMKAYHSNAFHHNEAKVSFDGASEISVGTAALTANDGDFAKFSKAESYTDRNVPVVCRVTDDNAFDYYIKNISIEYIVYTTAPSATDGIAEVDRTVNSTEDEYKRTVDVSTLFSYAVAPPEDFEFSYEIVDAKGHAFLDDGHTFWADSIGDYEVHAKVTMDEDHRESEWGSTKTIHVRRVPYIFNNSQSDNKWETEANWKLGGFDIEDLPTEDDDVTIRGYLILDEEISVRSVTIDGGAGGKVDIAPTGGLTVGAGGISGSTKDNFILKAGMAGATKGQTGYLRIDPEYNDTMPHASVELYSIAYYDQSSNNSAAAQWQHVGTPIDTTALAKTVFTKSWIYDYDERTDKWLNNRKTLVMAPFVGYATTQYKSSTGILLTFPGKLVQNRGTKTIDLKYSGPTRGHNRIANSFAAPIDITQFIEADFVDAEKTIYIYNTGSDTYKGACGNAAGQYIAISIGTADQMAEWFAEDPSLPRVIAPMQGFCVNATAKDAKFKLDYGRLVWSGDYSSHPNKPLRAPKRSLGLDDQESEQPITGAMKISLTADELTDHIYLLESERYDVAFEDGYDAHKLEGGDFNIFTVESEDMLAIDATNSIKGTRVGVRTSEETLYTMSFNYVSDEKWALYDGETAQTIDINEDTQYTFFVEPNAQVTDRFMIVERAQAPSVATGVDGTSEGVKAHKFIKGDQMYILKNGVLYNAMGAIVR